MGRVLSLILCAKTFNRKPNAILRDMCVFEFGFLLLSFQYICGYLSKLIIFAFHRI